MKKQELHNYLNNAISPYHAVDYCSKKLCENGFTELYMTEKFSLSESGKYFVRPYPTMLVSFVMPATAKSFRIMTAHTDYPTFKLKPVYKMAPSQNTVRINVEPYGGSLRKTWFDRPLGIAGNVIIKTDDPFKPATRLFDSKKPIAVIPSLAPHMDRDIEKSEVDPARHMNPIISLSMDDINLDDYIASVLEINKEDISSYDLFLYDTEEATAAGINDELILSGRIDNIASCAAINDALCQNFASHDFISMGVLFDNEEIGSRSKQGADSNILNWIIKKICYDSNICQNESELISILSNSCMLSIDGAHAVHPSYPDKADITSTAYLGKGFVLKTSASQRYVCDPMLLSTIKEICNNNDIPYQVQANKSGTPGGQTLGPILTSYLPIPAVDMGVPMLAMHSIKETSTYKDFDSLLACIKEFIK